MPFCSHDKTISETAVTDVQLSLETQISMPTNMPSNMCIYIEIMKLMDVCSFLALLNCYCFCVRSDSGADRLRNVLHRQPADRSAAVGHDPGSGIAAIVAAHGVPGAD